MNKMAELLLKGPYFMFYFPAIALLLIICYTFLANGGDRMIRKVSSSAQVNNCY